MYVQNFTSTVKKKKGNIHTWFLTWFEGPTYVNNRTQKNTEHLAKKVKENMHIQRNHIYLSSKIIRDISSRDIYNKKLNFKEKRQ